MTWLYDLCIVVGAPLLRSVAGWLNNSLKDGIIQDYEWKQLLTTVIRVGIPAAALYFGLNMSAEVSAAIPLLAEYAYDYFKNHKNA